MENAVPSDGRGFPHEGEERAPASPLERLASFRFTYVAFFVFLVTYVFSVLGLEAALEAYFQSRITEAAAVDPASGYIRSRLRERIDAVALGSLWVDPGGVRVDAIALGADGQTLLYTSRGLELLPDVPEDVEEADLLPATVDVAVTVPHNALAANAFLVAYAAFLLSLLFAYTRVLTRREQERLAAVVAARDVQVDRVSGIEAELTAVRGRLARLEPARQHQADEIRSLQSQRTELVARLRELEEHEERLRAEESEEVRELREEHEALESLLDEALSDVTRRDDEIRELQRQLKQSGRTRGAAARETSWLERRLRTLYKDLEFDDRVVSDITGLGDEAMKLKAEEAIKRLADDADHTAVRRKVGGLPPQLSIFELGFGGRGRIYYTRGRARRHRVLLVGTKASQKPDLEYLSRLPRD